MLITIPDVLSVGEVAQARAALDAAERGDGEGAGGYQAASGEGNFPPVFNRYAGGGHFGTHVDTAIRAMASTGQRIRTDVSATLFLSAPEEYEGGELSVEDTYGVHSVKLPAGHMVLYPATSLHRVAPGR